MNYIGIVKYAFEGLAHRQLRSWLTIVGIIIGVAVVVSLISVADGVTGLITSELERFGADAIFIMPGGYMESMMSATPAGAPVTSILTNNDLEVVKKVSGIEYASPMILVPGLDITFKGETLSSPVGGLESDKFTDAYPEFEVEEGRFIQENDKGVVVVGYGFAHYLFEEDIDVNSKLTIRNRQFRVIGVMKELGGLGSQDDNNVYISLSDAEDLAKGYLTDDEVSMIFVKVEEGADIHEVQEDIEFELRSYRKVREGEEDFMVMSYEFMKEQVDAVLGILTLFMFAISAISFVIGAIGVSNTMFMSVMERTKEIGILKSIGATKNDILLIFLCESAMIGFVGGVLGLAIGFVVSLVVSSFGLPTLISPFLAIGAVFFSMVISAVSGFIPANNAANMSAIDALRAV